MISYCREPRSNAWKLWDVLGSWLSLPGAQPGLQHAVPCPRLCQDVLMVETLLGKEHCPLYWTQPTAVLV